MRFPVSRLFAISCLTTALCMAVPVYADVITATVYENTPNSQNAGDPANSASGLAHASFNIGSSGVNFQTNNSPGTSIANFLNNPTFFNATANFDPNVQVNNSELVLIGTVYLLSGSNSFVIGHDDGVVLDIPAIGLHDDAGGPTSFTTTPFNVNNPGAAGTFNFTLQYAECCGGPADLLFTVNNAPLVSNTTPEPSSLALLGTGVLAIAGAVRRRFIA